jgi:HEPN domain-containing protein
MQRDPGRADAPRRWLQNARGDLSMARVPLPEDATYEMLCFHAQQAAEKAIKAVLLAKGVDFPFTHNLQLLIDRIPSGVDVPPQVTRAVDLTPYAVITRYPGENEPVSEEEYRESLQLAEEVVKWAESVI